MRCIVAIKPEARRQIYWTMVSIDTLVSIGATSASSLERFVATFFGEPIRTSNCGLAWSSASSRCGVLRRKGRFGERTQPRRQWGASSAPDRKVDLRVVDRGNDSAHHKLIHR